MDKVLQKRRQRRIRSKVNGTAARPRVCVNRSHTRISVQLIDDGAHHTIASAIGKPEEAGKKIAELAKKAGITRVVFDRAGNRYHGRIKKVADTIREAGLEF